MSHPGRAACRLAVAALLAVALLAGGAAAAKSAAKTSELWGKAGEKWTPDGLLMDFSYAGYKYGDEPIPTPPTTKTLADFQTAGATDTAAVQALLEWGNAQPADAGWVVLELPEGELTIAGALNITRNQTVLRGAGRDQTTLLLTQSMTDIYGKSPISESGYWVFHGALVSIHGPAAVLNSTSDVILAGVDATTPVPRGTYDLQVNTTELLSVDDIVTLEYRGAGNTGNNSLAHEVMDYKLDPGSMYANDSVYFTSRIAGINGKTVTLERALPWAVRKEFEPVLTSRMGRVHNVGIEGMTLKMNHTPYLGHHLELGMSGLQFAYADDSWVRDLRVLNADNAVLVFMGDRITVENLEVDVTKPRNGPTEGPYKVNFDGHWGVRTSRSQDSLVTGYREKSHVVHSLGSDGAGLFSVFRDAQMRFGTMEMHRGQSSMNLFTDIDVGDPVHALYNGGPPVNGPNSGARTVYWGITSDGDGLLPPPRHNAASRTPGNCTFGPNLVFVGVKFEDWICEDWTYEPDVTSPKDLYLAQLERRRGSSAAPKGAVQPAAEGATSSEGAEAAEPAADKLLADLLPADKPPADKPSAVELPSDEPLAVEQRSTDEPRRMLRR